MIRPTSFNSWGRTYTYTQLPPLRAQQTGAAKVPLPPAAVIRLDVEDLHPERDSGFLRLYPDFAAAAEALGNVLPSVNLIGAKAKQFDDGLYAALDLAMLKDPEGGIVGLVRRIRAALDPSDAAHALIYGALEVGGHLSSDELALHPGATQEFVQTFLEGEEAEPVGFYTWNEELRKAFRFLRFLQQPLENVALVGQIRGAIESVPDAFDHYGRILRFYGGLTNAPIQPSLFSGEARPHFLPAARSPESGLHQRLYPLGLPPGADLMRDFIRAIREGRLDLKPTADSGWYDYQIHALETFLLPGRGEESNKLLLTAKYKQRLLEAFKALVTRSRETHIRGIFEALETSRPPMGSISPRLRVEPNPSYYLRMAQSYGFLRTFLAAEPDRHAHALDLNRLHGLREGGRRARPLGDELEWMRLFFYGLYLLSCEDIGLKPSLMEGELVQAEMATGARKLAEEWLEKWREDPDLNLDVRVCVPVYKSQNSRRYWGTIGVRGLKLDADYARRPSWRPWPGEGQAAEWQEVPAHETEPVQYNLLVDEFAEFDLSRPLTRDRFRSLCDQGTAREAILGALRR